MVPLLAGAAEGFAPSMARPEVWKLAVSCDPPARHDCQRHASHFAIKGDVLWVKVHVGPVASARLSETTDTSDR